MFRHTPREKPLDTLALRLGKSAGVTPALAADLVAACPRLRLLPADGEAARRVVRMIRSGAWTDAILALLPIELPGWTLRRLVHEDDEWFCALSRQPALPIDLDDTADGHHRILALALIGAFLEARRRMAAGPQSRPSPPAHEALPREQGLVCCDNFA